MLFFPDAVSEDAFQSEYLRYYWMMQRSSLLRSRSRRPLSVDDVHVADAFLNESPLDNGYESSINDSGVFLPSPLSFSGSFSYSEGLGKSSPDISVPLKTSTPNSHRWLYSCPEGKLKANNLVWEGPLKKLREEVEILLSLYGVFHPFTIEEFGCMIFPIL